MKFAVLLFFFVFTQAHAACTPEITSIFLEEDSTFEAFKVSENHRQFNSLERRMILAAIKSDGYTPQTVSMQEALTMFADINEWSHGKPGSNAGSISYFKLNKKVLAKVVYYPGDNEFGAIFEVKGNGYQLLTTVSDGDLGCL